MLQFFAWYFTVTILGLLTFPLAYRLLPALADRGYALSRSLGLLLWGFVFWLAVSLGLAENNLGGLLLALAVLAGLAVWANWKKADNDDWRSIPAWLKANRGYVVSVELLFFLAFAAWAFVRANNPELTGTEKPMEIAFINAIIHSPNFPPHDPWLSGYAISYYYFGYVLTAMLAEITSTVGSVAFNLMIALIFGLSAIGAYGLLYNLLKAYWQSQGDPDNVKTNRQNPLRALFGAFLAPLFLIVLGNWEGLLEMFHRAGIGWTGSPGDVNFWTRLGLGYPTTALPGAPALPEGVAPPHNFWTWLNMKDLSDVPLQPLGWLPDRYWWWWRASRVVHDYNLQGKFDDLSPIDEFPFFSYLLGDLHPHVLAMPFGLLAGALALNLYLGGWQGETTLFKFPKYEIKFPVRLEGFVLLAVALGGLAFLNTWDFPIYLALVCGALLLMLVQERGWSWDLLEEFLSFSIPLALLSVVLYLPFYIGFSSQAGGILPNVIFPTRGVYLWIMFGGLFLPIFAFLIYLRRKEQVDWAKGFLVALGVTLLLWLFSIIAALIGAQTEIGREFITSQGLSSTWDVLREATLRRLVFGVGLMTLLALIGGAAAYLIATKVDVRIESRNSFRRSPIPFVMMFILFGGLLVLAPEFVYLRDQFGARMNTVFKFYYEAWALWSIVAAFAAVVMLSELRRWKLGAFTTLVVILIGIGLVYPVFSIPNKTNGFDASRSKPNPDGGQPLPPTLTLDGAAYIKTFAPDDYAAIQFLAQAAPGTLVTAVGGSYRDEFGIAATYSGQPAVLNWPGHESQWRGGDREMGTRETDIRVLYSTIDWDQADEILKQYGIRYVYIGPTERQTYSVNEDKFAKNLAKIYDQGQVVIYLVP